VITSKAANDYQFKTGHLQPLAPTNVAPGGAGFTLTVNGAGCSTSAEMGQCETGK
jgi:hypothetical protein